MISNGEQKEKLGNGIRLILAEFGSTTKTSLLKLLYFIDEKSVKKCGNPVFDIDYRVWQYGPVNPDLYVELSEGAQGFLKDYISESDGIFSVNGSFSDDEFSDFEIDLIRSICHELKKSKAFQLVDASHKKDGLWYEVALRNNLLESFSRKEKTTSDVKLDLGELVKNDPFLRAKFDTYKEISSRF